MTNGELGRGRKTLLCKIAMANLRPAVAPCGASPGECGCGGLVGRHTIRHQRWPFGPELTAEGRLYGEGRWPRARRGPVKCARRWRERAGRHSFGRLSLRVVSVAREAWPFLVASAHFRLWHLNCSLKVSPTVCRTLVRFERS